MKSYLLSILVISLSASCLFHLLPEKTSFQKSMRFLSALFILLLLLSPLAGAKDALGDFFSSDWSQSDTLRNSYEEKSQESLLSHSKDYVERLVKEELVKTFSLREQDVSVRLLIEEGRPNQVVLILSGKAIWQDSAKLEDFVSTLTELPCSSVIK